VGETTRKTQKESVRLLARNIPPVFSCSACGEPAAVVCTECMYDTDNPFFCETCGEAHEHEDMMLSVANSPRMGECGYEGELDTFAFNTHFFSEIT
jgi:transcription elongation factor Elf1